MNEYLFFTTEGETIAPNADIEVENCQLLGRVHASCVDEAQLVLLKENPWIKRAGFSLEGFIREQIATREQLSNIQVIVDFLLDEVSKSTEIGKRLPTFIITRLKSLKIMVSNHHCSL